MAISVVCPSCLRRLKFQQSESGLSRKCPGCGTEMTVPGKPVPVEKVRTEESSRRNEFIIAGLILVVALAGAWFLVKRIQEGQKGTVARPKVQQPAGTETPVEVKKKVVEVTGPFTAMSEHLKKMEETELGPAQVLITDVATVTETPIKKAPAGEGKQYAVVGLEVKKVASEKVFDTYDVVLMSRTMEVYRVLAVTGTDVDGNPTEVPRWRVMPDSAKGSTRLKLYIKVPADLDPKTCELQYR